MEKEASVIGNEVKELKRQLKEAKQTEKQNLKEEKKERKKQQKLEQARFREEERMRKVQMKEEKKLKKELDKPEVHKEKENISNLREDRRKEKKERKSDLDLLPVTWVSSYLPIRQIKNGVIYTTDHRYVKLIEILPINFLLRSSSEQRNIIMSFMSYLKIAPVKIQFKVVSKKADISEYIEKIKEEAEREPDHRVKLLQEDYAKLIERLGRKEAITRRFFMVFEYQSYNNNKNPKEREVLLYMRSVVQTAKKYLSQCGNVVLEYENDTRFLVDVLYQILNRRISDTLTLRTDCLYQENGHYIVRMYQVKTSYYEKPIPDDVAKLIQKSMEYTYERYGGTEYVFVNESNPSLPFQYSMLKHRVYTLIHENDICKDNGERMGFATHLFRHCYGMKLVELHLDDAAIAHLLGHRGVNTVYRYRRASGKLLVKETEELRKTMDEILSEIIKEWDGYEQVFQNG